MISSLPLFISVAFVGITLLTFAIFMWIVRGSSNQHTKAQANKIAISLFVWILVQGGLGWVGVYRDYTDLLPPAIFLFGVLPTVLAMGSLFFTRTGKAFARDLPREKLVYIHLIRVPVEFILLWLFMQNQIPEIMTFEGFNFDIIIGLTAPLIIYFGYKKALLSRTILMFWNFLGLISLAVIFVMAILSSPFPLQQLAFDQPNVGLLYFPFSWLPTIVVPLVIFCHLVSISQLRKTAQ
jgi:hypothetical protein